MNISALTKGFILPQFKYKIRLRRGGSLYGDNYDQLKNDLQKQNIENIDYIKVYVDWNNNNNKYDKKIYVELIKKKIEVKLLNQIKKQYNITVELLNK